MVREIHVSTGLYASSSGWAALLVDEFPRWGLSVLLLSWPVCSSASCRISFCYLVLISGRRSASISNPSGWCFSSGPCTTNLAMIFLYSHHLGLSICLSACISACYAWLPQGNAAYSTPWLLCYVGRLDAWPWRCNFPASLVLPVSANGGCGGFAGFTCHSFLLLFTTVCLHDSGFFSLSIYPVNTLLSSHLHLVLLLSQLLKLEINIMLISYGTADLYVFAIRHDLPLIVVQLLPVIECKHNFSTTDIFFCTCSAATQRRWGAEVCNSW